MIVAVNYIFLSYLNIYLELQSCRLERTCTGHVVQSTWTTKQLEQVAHGLDVILPIKLTHWHFTQPCYFVLSFVTVGRFERKRNYKDLKEENF